MDQTILEVYNRISQKKSFRDRVRLGNRGDLIEIEDNQIIKADKPGEDNTAWEFEVLVALEELGITPKPAVEEGVFGHPNSFQMEKINDGTTLEEYAEKKMAILQELPSPEDDLNFLDSAFTMIFEIMRIGENSQYWEGLRTLKNEILAF